MHTGAGRCATDRRRDRERFVALLDTRAAQHERQRVVAVSLLPDGNFEVLGTRVADDLPAGGDGPVRATRGKGRVDCADRSVEALSLAVEGAPGRRGEFQGQRPVSGASPEQLHAAVHQAVAELS